MVSYCTAIVCHESCFLELGNYMYITQLLNSNIKVNIMDPEGAGFIVFIQTPSLKFLENVSHVKLTQYAIERKN